MKTSNSVQSPRWVIVYLLSALAGCQSLARNVSDKEDLLAAAGFMVQPATTPQQIKSMDTLPANKFLPMPKGNAIEYVYADPVVCHCLYVGDQLAFNAYKKEVFTRDIVNQQQLTAETYEDQWNWAEWNWNSWGPGIRW
jgi:hypothetical protein